MHLSAFHKPTILATQSDMSSTPTRIRQARGPQSRPLPPSVHTLLTYLWVERRGPLHSWVEGGPKWLKFPAQPLPPSGDALLRLLSGYPKVTAKKSSRDKGGGVGDPVVDDGGRGPCRGFLWATSTMTAARQWRLGFESGRVLLFPLWFSPFLLLLFFFSFFYSSELRIFGGHYCGASRRVCGNGLQIRAYYVLPFRFEIIPLSDFYPWFIFPKTSTERINQQFSSESIN